MIDPALDWLSLPTGGKIDALRAVWTANTPAATIAGRLIGCSKNALVGLYNRNPWLRAEIPLKSAPRGPDNKGVRKSERRDDAVRRPMKSKPMKPVNPTKYDASAIRLVLDQLTMRTCKWPVDGPDDQGFTYFCGHPSEIGRSYCAHHIARASGRGTEAERAGVRALKSELLK